MGSQGRRRRQLLDDLKETIGYSKLERVSNIAVCGELALQEAMDPS
jgi:hypothetical protein